jgi:predicted secreted Zn-dependent protease
MGGSCLTRTRCLIFATAAILLSAASGYGEVIVRQSTKYFPVTGQSGIELGNSMVRGASGLTDKHDAIAATAAEYHIGEADIAIRNGRCVVLDVNIVLDLVYHLPRWKNEGTANPRLRAIWRKFHAELVKHERMHGEIAKKGAVDLERALKNLSGTVAFNCNDFGAFAEARLRFLAKLIQLRHDSFDRRENYPGSAITRLQISLIQTP